MEKLTAAWKVEEMKALSNSGKAATNMEKLTAAWKVKEMKALSDSSRHCLC